MAEAIFNHEVNKLSKKDLKAISAGTIAAHADGASGGSFYVCEKNGLDLSSHQSQAINRELLESVDLIYCITSSHARYLLNKYPEYENKIKLMPSGDVSDPFGGDLNDYEKCFEQIKNDVMEIINKL